MNKKEILNGIENVFGEGMTEFRKTQNYFDAGYNKDELDRINDEFYKITRGK